MIIKSNQIKEQLTNDLVEKYKNRNKKLVVINQNDDISTLKFIESKRKLAEKLGVGFELINFDVKDSKERIISKINELNNDNLVNGIIIQLPIVGVKDILMHIALDKDIDCLSPYNLGLFMRDQSVFMPPVIFAVDQILKNLKIEIKGKNVLVIGAGILTGEPLAGYFMKNEAELMVINKYVGNLSVFTKQADIIISATGSCNLITDKYVVAEQLLIDLGGGTIDGKLVGDINTNSVAQVADIVPIPGGAGPLTVLGIFYNLLSTK